MFSSGHPPKCPKNCDALAWLEEGSQLTLTPDNSFLYLADLSSLSDEDDNSHKVDVKQGDTTNYSPERQEKIESNLHLLGHFRHKSLIGSEIVASAATIMSMDEDSMKRNAQALPVDDCCNASEYPSKFLCEPSFLENHCGRTRLAMDHDALSAAGAHSSVTLSSSSNSLVGSPVPNLALCTTIAKPRSTAYQQQQNEQGTGNCKQMERNTGVSLDLQPKEGNRRSGRHTPNKSSCSLPVGTSHAPPLGSSKQVKSNKAKTHNVDSSLGEKVRIVLEGQDDVEESELLRRATPATSSPGNQTTSRDAMMNPHANKKKKKDKKIDPWYIHFQELMEYKTQHGDCNVPFCYKNENPFLAAWVKRQRYQYKCKIRGKHSHLTYERQSLLEELGFVWDSHVAAWEENFALMAEFYQKHGHCCVPIKQKELSDWAKRQRRLYRNLQQSESSTTSSTTISEDRIRRLNEINFQWATTTTPIRHAKQEAFRKKRKMSSSILSSYSSIAEQE